MNALVLDTQTVLLSKQLELHVRLSQPMDDDAVEWIQRQRVQRQLQSVDDALYRFAVGTYGRCLNCRRPIDPERLVLLPEAPLCTECQRQAERKHIHHIS